MKKHGFTLVELLAVLVILGIALSIAIPSINGVIISAKGNTFSSNAKLILKSIDLKESSNESFDPSVINENNIEEILKVSDDNYKTISITNKEGIPNIVAIGKENWDGLVAYGTKQDITVVTEEEFEEIYPIITLLGDNPINIVQGSTYDDAGATASDLTDGNMTDDIVITGNIDTNVIGTYYKIYSVTNSKDNTMKVMRRVNVIDGVIPVITMLGDNPVTINVGDTYEDAGATASDNIDGDITDDIVAVSTVNPSETGSYTVTYNVKDSSGNNATSLVRTVNVIDNTRLANANIHETSVPSGYTGIYTLEDLYNIRNNLGGSYILMNNLDFNNNDNYTNIADKATYTTGSGWLPIGTSTAAFSGNFNGNNYTISNLYINRNTSYIGLFGYVNGNNTKNIEKLGLMSVNITGATYVGGLIGRLGFTNVKNDYVTGTVVATSSSGAGLIGTSTGTSGTLTNIENCYSTATISGGYYLGGITGWVTYTNIVNSYATGNVSSTGGDSSVRSGILIGYRYSGTTVTNSYISNTATLSYQYGAAVTEGSLATTNELKSELFISSVLNWDVKNTWDVTDNSYPKLGGTARIVADPVYEITKIEDLYLMRKDLAGTYTLMNDLDFNSDSSYRNINNKVSLTTGYGWLPIGTSSAAFSGSFNGNNHKISNLYINKNVSYVGLFGYVNGNNTKNIEKLGLESVNITGTSYVGGLIGRLGFTNVKNDYVTGLVTATSNDGGGIAGHTVGTSASPTNIENCYSTASVSGGYFLGGITGWLNYTNIKNSFVAGNVTSTGGDASVNSGIIVGRRDAGGTITNSYKSNTATLSYQYGSATTDGILATTNELKAELFISSVLNWDVANIWDVSDNSYPKLGGTAGIIVGPVYEITKIEDLYLMRKDLTGTYTLMNDLDFNSDSSYRNLNNKTSLTSGYGWMPIGTSTTAFSGSLNGNNHKISNLYINRSADAYIGLFGYVNGNNTKNIEKLGLISVNVTGASNVGGLIGRLGFTNVKNNYVTGAVTATSNSGAGIAGYSTGTSTTLTNIENCYSTATISGGYYLGGITGWITYTNLKNSFAAGNVTSTGGDTSVKSGILMGYRYSGVTTTNSYRSNTATLSYQNGGATTDGTAAAPSDLQNLNLTGISAWDTTTIWQKNTGAYPTFK